PPDRVALDSLIMRRRRIDGGTVHRMGAARQDPSLDRGRLWWIIRSPELQELAQVPHECVRKTYVSLLARPLLYERVSLVRPSLQAPPLSPPPKNPSSSSGFAPRLLRDGH